MEKIGVALFVYKRPQYTLKTLENLQKNIVDTDIDKIYVFQDGLKKEEDKADWEEVNKIIKGIDFIDVEFIVSNKNKGLANSIMDGINYVFEKQDMVITLEDDCSIGKSYFDFMKACLKKYKHNQSVMCVSGYCWPIKIPKDYRYDAYFSYRMSSLGWGTWKDRWGKYTRDFRILKEVKLNEEKNKILQLSGDDIIPILQEQLEGKVDSWAIFWQLMQTNNLGVCVQPIKPLAEDIGRDGGGTNTTEPTSRYDVELFNDTIEKFDLPNEVEINDEIIENILTVLNTIPSNIRFKNYYELLNKWIVNLYNKHSLKEYFIKNNITKVYIYGAGNLTTLLIKEISTYTEVKGIIVENKNVEKFNEFNVYSSKDNLTIKDEVIIVTPIYDYKYIKNKLNLIYNTTNIISLKSLINEEDI